MEAEYMFTHPYTVSLDSRASWKDVRLDDVVN